MTGSADERGDRLFDITFAPPGVEVERETGSDSVDSGSEAFDSLRSALGRDPALREEMEWALRLTVESFNPTNRANRFVVGGVVEWILAAACFKAGVLALPDGHDADGFDLVELRSHARGLWSVKSSFSTKVSSYIITNGRGGAGAGRGMQDPTVFLSPRLPGLVLVDPVVHPDVAAMQVAEKDSTTLSLAAVARHAERRPACVVPLKVPINPGAAATDAALDATRLLLSGSQFARLQAMFRASEPRRDSTVTGELRRLQRMRQDGHLTEEQYQSAVNLAVGATP